MEQYFYKSRWVDSTELHWTVKNGAFWVFNLLMLLWGDKSCGHHLFVTSLDKDRCSSFQSLLEIFWAVMFCVTAVKESKREKLVCVSWRSRPAWAVLRCLPCLVFGGWSWCFAKLFACKRMWCHCGLRSSWELVFLQAIGRIGEPIDLRQRKNKLTLPKRRCAAAVIASEMEPVGAK